MSSPTEVCLMLVLLCGIAFPVHRAFQSHPNSNLDGVALCCTGQSSTFSHSASRFPMAGAFPTHWADKQYTFEFSNAPLGRLNSFWRESYLMKIKPMPQLNLKIRAAVTHEKQSGGIHQQTLLLLLLLLNPTVCQNQNIRTLCIFKNCITHNYSFHLSLGWEGTRGHGNDRQGGEIGSQNLTMADGTIQGWSLCHSLSPFHVYISDQQIR